MVKLDAPRRLFVLGASGGTGKAVVELALQRGFHVTAFVRSPEKLTGARDRLAVIRGNPLDAAALAAALPGHDAVISALGPPGPGRTTIAADGARSTVLAMQRAGLRRLMVVGVAVLFEDIGLLAALLRRTLLRNVANDSAEMERIVRASELDWTIVRPPRLTNGPRTGAYDAADQALPGGAGGAATISRADLADFMLAELQDSAYVRKIVGVAVTRAARLAARARA